MTAWGKLKRPARYPDGWRPPRTFSMGSSRGYWRIFVLPKIDLETGSDEYRGALPKVPASPGVGAGGIKPSVEVEKETGKGKGGGTERLNRRRGGDAKHDYGRSRRW